MPGLIGSRVSQEQLNGNLQIKLMFHSIVTLRRYKVFVIADAGERLAE